MTSNGELAGDTGGGGLLEAEYGRNERVDLLRRRLFNNHTDALDAADEVS